MTRAPVNLLAARRVLLDRLADGRPGVLDPLAPIECGIVGDSAHRGGYHCGSDRVVDDDYSVIESARDRAGLTLDAAAMDVGKFRVHTAAGTFDLPHYSRWLVAQCAAGTSDTRHIREVIYSPDGKTVRRWDRLGRRSTGDRSHLIHTHKSYFRDAVKAGADVAAVERRYLTHIERTDDMATFTDEHARTLDQLGDVLGDLVDRVAYADARLEAAAAGRSTVRTDLKGGGSAVWLVAELQRIGHRVDQLAAGAGVPVDQLAAELLARLTPEAIGAAVVAQWPADQASKLADVIADRLAE